MKISKKQAIIASLVLLFFVSASLFYYLISKNTFVADESQEKQETQEEVGEGNSIEPNKEDPVDNVKNEFSYMSDDLGVGMSFSKVKIIWESIGSRKKDSNIYLRVKVGSIWSEWTKYNLSLDPSTRNTTYTTGDVSLSGVEIQYALNFEEGEYIRGLLFNFSGDANKEILIDEVKNE